MNVAYKTFLTTALFCSLALSSYAEEVMSFYNDPVKVPKVTWSDIEGNEISLDDFKGKVVLLNLWATWCTPCVIEMPAFNFLQKRYKAGGFEVIPVAVNDTPEAVKAFMEKGSLKYLTPYLDSANMVTNTFQPKSTPTTYLINRKGEVVAGKEGLSEWLAEDMMNLIETELKKDQPVFNKKGITITEPAAFYGGIHR